MKQLFQLLTVFALVLTVSCTKTSGIDPDNSLDVITTSDELLSLGQGTSGSVSGPMGGDPRSGKTRECRHPNGGRGEVITFGDLPANAQTYLNANTDVTLITRIVKITLKDGTVRYGVRLSDRTHYHFDATGALIVDEPRGNKFVEITLAELPQVIRDYLTANGHTTDIDHIVKVTKADGTVIYGVRLTTNTMITFDATGAVIPNPKRKRGHH